METFIAIIALAQGPHHQTRYFGEFPSEEKCLKFVNWQLNAVNRQGLESIAVCRTKSEFRSFLPAAFVEEPST